MLGRCRDCLDVGEWFLLCISQVKLEFTLLYELQSGVLRATLMVLRTLFQRVCGIEKKLAALRCAVKTKRPEIRNNKKI